MDPQALTTSGEALMFVLGLRHGLDPDHIACIDGLTWRTLDRDRRLAPWIGSLFALGHGLLVTTIAVAVSLWTRSIEVPTAAVQVFEWIPTALLFLVGLLNLRQLVTRSARYEPRGWKLRMIPGRLRDHSSPFAVVLTGVLFATVFDTATQASAWGFVATSRGGAFAALAAGLLFTAGMFITDTLDGRLLFRVLGRADALQAGLRYRRALGWLIVLLSFGVAGYNVAKAWVPSIELGDASYSMLGLALLTAVILMWAWMNRRPPLTVGRRASPRQS